ncbi:MAG: T9SS type A sorting domain-containing protein [Bacteroidia bacterium]|nr:T9SS type A sorting domain-containing protein [Bacteroidia bacterium]
MKKLVLVCSVVLFSFAAQAQLRFGFTNPLDYDNWNVNDTSAGVELVVWTPNNDTLRFNVGADVSAVDGNARNGIEFNFQPQKWWFAPGTNIYDTSNKKVLKYNLTPNTTFFGEKDFYIILSNYEGITASQLMYGRSMMRVIVDYDGTNVGIKRVEKNTYRVFPVPATNALHVEGVNPSSYKIMDMSGRVTQTGDVLNNSIEVSALQSGLYVLYAETDRGLLVQKFSKY